MKLDSIFNSLIDKDKLSNKNKDYMSVVMLEYFRMQLVKWRSELMESVDKTLDTMRNDNQSYSDEGDIAKQFEQSSFHLRTRDRERKLLKKINDSIYQIDKKTYGYCVKCKNKIGIKRLAVRPTATLCINCKSIEEELEKIYDK